MKKLVPVLAFVFVFAGQTYSQILPPDFTCVRGDTLFWNLPTNNCGPSLGYEIWGSQSPTGPFTLQGTVTNQSQDYYPFINPSGAQWYFYLLSKFDCPGLTAIPSDTLDNRPPAISPIEVVTVENGQAVVNWYPSPSPEVTGYIIYRETSIGVVPVDTIYGSTTFTDPNADPNAQPESYFVNALDPCGNTSIFDAKHSSIFLGATVVPCRQSVVLDWNPYQGWTNGIAEQQIWVGLNGGALTQAAEDGPSASSFEVEDVVDGATYCFEVHAVEAGTGVVSKSNQICIQVSVIASAKGSFLKNVSVGASGEVQVDWEWPPAAEIAGYQILRSDQNAGYQAIATLMPTPPLSASNSYNDATADAAAGKVFYKIETRDLCDSVLTTNYGSTIFLTATALPGNINQLNWTAFDIENATVGTYTLYKVVSGSASQLDVVGSGTTSFDDAYDPTSLAEAQACYYVVANGTILSPDGQSISINSRSNTACVEQAARIFVPNAFVPEGFNQEFRPLIVLGDIASYEMRIFDRYGQEVFATSDPAAGWYGQKNGKNLAQGVYAYVIKLTQASGKKTEKRGTVLLIR
jgi:gliding motility-associated-like protein